MSRSTWPFIQQSLLMAFILAFFSGPASAQTALFEDSFVLREKQQPPNWRFIGPKGSQYWIGTNGRLDSGDSSSFTIGPSIAVISATGSEGWSDYTIGADITPSDADREGKLMLVARVRDNSNYFAATLAFAGSGPGALRLAEIIRVQNGAEFVIAETDDNQAASLPDFSAPNSGPYRLSFTLNGDNLSLKLDGRELLKANNNAFSQGSAGLGVFMSHAYFDNVRVESGAGSNVAAAPSGGTPAAAGPGEWRIVGMANLTRTDAETQAANLRSDGFVDVQALPGPGSDGRWAVYIGRYASEALAAAERKRVEVESGLVVSGVEFVEAARGGGGAPAASGGTQIRVQAGTFSNRNQAELLKSELQLNGGYYPVEVREIGREFIVLVGLGYTTRDDAQLFVQQLVNEGYPQASVREGVAAAAIDSVPGAPLTPDEVKQVAQQSGLNVGATETERVAQIAAQLEAALQSQSISESEKIRNEIQALNDAQRQLLNDIQKQREEDRTKRARISQLSADANAAISGGDILRAEQLINEISNIDRSSEALPLLRTLLVTAKKSAEPSGQSQAEQFAREAREKETLGDFFAALTYWERVRGAVQSGPLYEEAGQRISALRQQMPQQDSSSEGGSSNLGLIIGIVGGIAIIAVVVFIVMSKKGSKPAPAAATPRMSSIPPGGGLGGAMGGSSYMPVNTGGATPLPVPRQAPAETPATRKAPQAVPASDALAIPGVMGAAPQTPLPTPVGLDARIRPGTYAPAEAAGATPTPLAIPGGNRTPSSGAVPRPAPESGSSDHITPPSGEYLALPSSPEVALHGSSSGHVPVGSAFPAGVYYEQSFDDEEVGAPPRHWKGSYDYSTLLVANGGANGGRCIRYDKSKGTGSAYYSCKFPDASGRICAEFDIRCDDKNRYLIGFYIEKDEDFRQSISTIVHRTNPKSEPTLRLQNESHAYKFGSWVHVKYIIDLPRSLVDGWVDDISVAAGVRLTQAPKVINTLSIRDNSATTGILLIDNIRIYRIP